jgi:hypothetical protein
MVGVPAALDKSWGFLPEKVCGLAKLVMPKLTPFLTVRGRGLKLKVAI